MNNEEGFELEVIEAEEIDMAVQDGHPLVEAQPSEDNPAFALLNKALDGSADIGMIEKFMDLQERWEAGNARKAYAAAMARCQQEMQPIVAASEGEKTNSYYAKLGHINKEIAPVYGRHGFSLSFGHGKPEIEGEIRTTCRVLHTLGHFEDFFIDLPPDGEGAKGNVNKTAIHARASSNTYGRRYITMGIFNLSILSEDDDAALAGAGGFIEEQEAVELQTLCDQAGLKSGIVSREFGVDELRLLPAKKVAKARARIEQLAKARAKK